MRTVCLWICCDIPDPLYPSPAVPHHAGPSCLASLSYSRKYQACWQACWLRDVVWLNVFFSSHLLISSCSFLVQIADFWCSVIPLKKVNQQHLLTGQVMFERSTRKGGIKWLYHNIHLCSNLTFDCRLWHLITVLDLFWATCEILHVKVRCESWILSMSNISRHTRHINWEFHLPLTHSLIHFWNASLLNVWKQLPIWTVTFCAMHATYFFTCESASWTVPSIYWNGTGSRLRHFGSNSLAWELCSGCPSRAALRVFGVIVACAARRVLANNSHLLVLLLFPLSRSNCEGLCAVESLEWSVEWTERTLNAILLKAFFCRGHRDIQRA